MKIKSIIFVFTISRIYMCRPPYFNRLFCLSDISFRDLRDQVRKGKIQGNVEEQLRTLIGEVQAEFIPDDDTDVEAGALQAAAATASSSEAKVAAKVSEQSATTEADATAPHH